MKKPKVHKLDFEVAIEEINEPKIAYGNNVLWQKLGISLNLNSDIEALDLINMGVSKKVLNKSKQMMNFNLEEMANILHTTDRTLRRYTDETKLILNKVKV